MQWQGGNNEVNNTPVQWVLLFHMLFVPLPRSIVLKQHYSHFAHSVNVNSITEHRCIPLV